jgi:hypothetical protein
LIFVKHRSASGRLEELWEYDPVRKVVMLTFKLGAATPVHLDVPVSSRHESRFGAWAIQRADGETWEIVPYRFGGSELRAHPIHEALGGESVVLTNAPPGQALELEFV